MRSSLGLRRPNAGSIDVLGVDARADDADSRLHIERNTGVLFQDGALFSSLTVGENVQVPLKEHSPELPDSWRYELALLKVKLAGLPAEAIDKLPSQLSRSEEHTSELQSLMRISYAVFCLKKKIDNSILNI